MVGLSHIVGEQLVGVYCLACASWTRNEDVVAVAEEHLGEEGCSLALGSGDNYLVVLLVQSDFKATREGDPILILPLLLVVVIVVEIGHQLQSLLGYQQLELLIELGPPVPIGSCSEAPHQAKHK